MNEETTVAYQVEPLDRIVLDDTLRNYVCSGCWGNLSFKLVGDRWYALCVECQEETPGYTSKYFAERRREESESELIEARRNLAKVLGLETERQSVAKNLSDLGF
jgi:hypothetical protein